MFKLKSFKRGLAKVMSRNQDQIREQKNHQSEFCLEGKFLDLVIKDGYKLKGLTVLTSEGECYVKLSKHLRYRFDWRLAKGTSLQIIGSKKVDPKTGVVKLKAERIMGASFQPVELGLSIEEEPKTPVKLKPATILMCQKSDCMKRGGKSVCAALQQEINQQNLDGQVVIKATGCMKNCKAGANLVMPDKTRHSRIRSEDVPSLIAKHCPVNASISKNQYQEKISISF